MALVVGVNMSLAYRLRPLFRPSSPSRRVSTATATPSPRSGCGCWSASRCCSASSPAPRRRASGGSTSLWRNGTSFGTEDAYFKRDIGFYVFDLPWLHYLVDFAMAFVVVALLMAALVHYLYGGIRLQVAHDRLSGAAQAQLSVLLGVFVLAKAADYWLDRFDLVHQGGRLITGITYTDDHAVLPAKSILMGIALICAVLFFLNVWRRTWMLPSMGLALLALSAILLGLIWPGIVQQFQVDPTEADKEAPYIAANIDATRAAYDLEDVEVEDFTSQVDRRRAAGLARRPDVLGAAGRPAAGAADLRAAAAGARLLLGLAGARRRPLRDRGRGPGRWCSACASSTSPASPRATGTGPTCTPSTPTATASSPPTPTSVPRTTRSEADRHPVGRGAAGRPGRAEPRCSPTATRTGSTTASAAPTTPSSARRATAPDVELDLGGGERHRRGSDHDVRRRRRRRRSAGSSTSCCTP